MEIGFLMWLVAVGVGGAAWELLDKLTGGKLVDYLMERIGIK